MTTEVVKPKTLGDVIAGLLGGEQPTAVDVAMKMLAANSVDPDDIMMQTEIRDPRTMNQLKLMIKYSEQNGDYEEADLWRIAYYSRGLHMVSFGRKRETVLSKMFASLQTWLMGQPQNDGNGGKLRLKNR